MYTFNADLDLTTVCNRVAGFHVTETAGAAASVKLRNGSVTGTIIADLRFPAVAGGNSIHYSDGKRPLVFGKGLYVDVVSGTVTGTIVPT